MKSTIKRLLTMIVAIAIIATIVVPSGITTSASTLYRTKQIKVTRSSSQVVDSMDGVKAYYRRGGNDGSNKFYSCAAFVKRYYKQVYGKNVYNLLYNRTPIVTGDSVKKVSEPQVGDIVGMNTNHRTTHWAIVKQVHNNGTVTLIEQNWKWNQGGSTQTVLNRKIKISSARFYRLNSQMDTDVVSLAFEE